MMRSDLDRVYLYCLDLDSNVDEDGRPGTVQGTAKK